jgi:hypothetical protein
LQQSCLQQSALITASIQSANISITYNHFSDHLDIRLFGLQPYTFWNQFVHPFFFLLCLQSVSIRWPCLDGLQPFFSLNQPFIYFSQLI